MAAKTKSKEEVKHVLIPLHEKLSAAEAKKVMQRYNITVNELPKILISDAAIRHLDCKPGDVIKITRPSSTAGNSIYYRGVVSD